MSSPPSKPVEDPPLPGAAEGQADPSPTPPDSQPPKPKPWWTKRWIWLGVAAGVVVLGGVAWVRMKPSGPGVGFVSGNGRIEATEIDIATKLPGRVREVLVNEGDYVKVGQPLAQMQMDVLDAQRDEALAQSQQAVTAVASAEAQVLARRSDTAAAQAAVIERSSELDAAQRRLTRLEMLSRDGVSTAQELDDHRAKVHGTEAAVRAAEAQVAAAQAATQAAQSQVAGARSGVTAREATLVGVRFGVHSIRGFRWANMAQDSPVAQEPSHFVGAHGGRTWVDSEITMLPA